VASPVKLFQIEEPDGSPAEPDLPGAAIGVDLSGAAAEAAFAIGGNAVMLRDPTEFAPILPVPPATAPESAWRALFEGVRLRAERLLARPVTHAVAVLAAPPARAGAMLRAGAAAAGIEILDLPSASQLSGEDGPLLAAARMAEDLMPRSGMQNPNIAYFR
jgi:hypothetical protein